MNKKIKIEWWCFWLPISAKQLICHLLKTEPTQRMSITEFIKHPWINVSSTAEPCLGSNMLVMKRYLWDLVNTFPYSLNTAAVSRGATNTSSHQPCAARGTRCLGESQSKCCFCSYVLFVATEKKNLSCFWHYSSIFSILYYTFNTLLKTWCACCAYCFHLGCVWWKIYSS